MKLVEADETTKAELGCRVEGVCIGVEAPSLVPRLFCEHAGLRREMMKSEIATRHRAREVQFRARLIMIA